MSLNQKRIALIGVASRWGAQRRRTESGPDHLKSLKIETALQQAGISAYWKPFIYPSHSSLELDISDPLRALELVNHVNHDLAHVVRSTLETGDFPVVIGGDHAIAVGTWGAITTTLKCQKSFGLIWFDAHMDAHTVETTPSNAFHGMPVAALLGYGEPSFVSVVSPEPKLHPDHVALIGIRSYEQEESRFLISQNVRIIKMDEIRQSTFGIKFQEARSHVTTSTKGYGISLDLDGFDPTYAPGVGTPALNGLTPLEVLPSLKGIGQDPLLKGIEITEFNPHLDQGDKTAKLVEAILITNPFY